MVDHASVKRRLLLVTGYVTLNCFYIILGGLVMYLLEHNYEVDHLKEMSDYVEEVGLDQNKSDHLEELGVCTFPNHLYPHWTFTGSCFYAFTVITTIGYGLYAPVTIGGRIFTAIYAIPGIGVVAVVLGNIAGLIAEVVAAMAERHDGGVSKTDLELREFFLNDDLLDEDLNKNERELKAIPTLQDMDPEGRGSITLWDFKRLIAAMIRDVPDEKLMDYILGRLCPDYSNSSKLTDLSLSYDAALRGVALWFQLSAEVPTRAQASRRYLFLTAAGVFLWMGFWGVVFSSIESWTYSEGLWFSFVSLSTIGFGDFVPNTTMGRIFGFIFMAPGLGLMGAFFGVLADMFKRWRFTTSLSLLKKGLASDKLLEAQGFSSPENRRLYSHCQESQNDAMTTSPTGQGPLPSFPSSSFDEGHPQPLQPPPIRFKRTQSGSTGTPTTVNPRPVVHCPVGHVMKRVTPASNHNCNVCGEEGTLRCGQCDYTLCHRCLQHRSREVDPNSPVDFPSRPPRRIRRGKSPPPSTQPVDHTILVDMTDIVRGLSKEKDMKAAERPLS